MTRRRRRIWGLLLTTVLLAGGAVIWRSNRELDDKTPLADSLRFSSTEISLGRRYAGLSAEFELGLQNLSASSVEIRKVVAGCSCSAARVEPTMLPPGGRGRLVGKVRFPSQVGLYREQLAVVTDSGQTHLVTISAETVAPLKVTPPRIDLGAVRFGEKAGGKAEIRLDANAPGEEHLRILPGSGGPGLAANLVRKSNRTWLLETTLEARELGRVGHRIAVGLPQYNEPLAFVLVAAHIPPPVSVQPSRLHLGTVHQGQTLKFELDLEWGYDETELLAASTDIVSCKILPSAELPGRPANLQMSLRFDCDLGLVKDHLVIETRNPAWKAFIPIVAFVEESPDP